MSFKEQEKMLSDIRNLIIAKRELFSTKNYLLCCAYIFFYFIVVFYLYNMFYKDGTKPNFIIFAIIPLLLSITIYSFGTLSVSANELLSHDAISMLSSDTLNELKSFVSSTLLKNKVLFISQGEFNSFILKMIKKSNEIEKKKYNDEFKNKVDSILNGNRLNGGNNEI